MTSTAVLTTIDWLLRVAMAAAVIYAVHVVHRERREARDDALLALQWRLMELLPLPHLGDRGTLLAMLDAVAPGHDLALYTAAEPALLVARRHPLAPPGAAEARWVEVHRPALLDGRPVREAGCGTLIPLRLRDGHLAGTLIVATQDEITLDASAAGTLRHVAGLLACAPAPSRHAATWQAPARPR